MKNHLKHMLIGGAVLLVGLLVAGVPLADALLWAALLACPLMMAGMMFMMGRGHGNAESGHDHRPASNVRQEPPMHDRI
ncbi:hypothetical protein [Cellulomonas sp. ATA003]|uniref:hypothetical protein n=1 Tax=Cellulomonas sp. ATA003 TaxID=3073064 RepID=UPI002873C7B0|nr:hypothetical protein [Cellulomonas sp. ATA003]WNB86985.1 hypothetical protein REH70_07515 [Cellulomonas sp. ATA003]